MEGTEREDRDERGREKEKRHEDRKNKGINAQKCKLEKGAESVIKTKINLIFFLHFFFTVIFAFFSYIQKLYATNYFRLKLKK